MLNKRGPMVLLTEHFQNLSPDSLLQESVLYQVDENTTETIEYKFQFTVGLFALAGNVSFLSCWIEIDWEIK